MHRRSLADAAAGGRPLKEERLVYMRYTGQGHEIAVELPLRALASTDVDGGVDRSAFRCVAVLNGTLTMRVAPPSPAVAQLVC
jgi:hypothetical protein